MRQLIVFVLLILLSGCVWTGHNSDTGPAFFVFVKEGESATENGESYREGSACTYNLFGFLAFGDSSIYQAKKDASIQYVVSIEKKYVNILYLYGQACTLVYGK